MQNGFFEMRAPGDLLQKLIHDLDRLKADPLSTYAAFDFFVTADHMLDWEFPDSIPGARETKIELRRANQLLAICSHLGNGAKHFELTNSRHKSVRVFEFHPGVFDPEVFSNAFDVSRLVVRFSDEFAQAFGESIGVVELANRVLNYWVERLTVSAEGPLP
jgi:hypothetical protein